MAKIYIGDATNKARSIKAAYIGVGGVARKIIKGYIGDAAGKARLFWSAELAFTKLADPTTLPNGTGFSCAFSPDGTYLAVAHYSSPYITIYKRSGDIFTKLANPATLPASTGFSCAFSPDGTYLAVGYNSTPYITIYK
jgi:WD40 repeat protein